MDDLKDAQTSWLPPTEPHKGTQQVLTAKLRSSDVKEKVCLAPDFSQQGMSQRSSWSILLHLGSLL